MRILLTNDDGIYAPGLAAMERELAQIADVTVVAPATEQSGVGHSITYLRPLMVEEVFEGERRRGWAVEGSPADCVKVGVNECLPQRPDLVVSGLNGGLNAGINVLYSGTVAAAIEGAFYQITSIAVSLEYARHAGFDKAAVVARRVIEQILSQKGKHAQLYNVNIPQRALTGRPEVRVVPMAVMLYGERYERRLDPRGRSYFWALGSPLPQPGGEEDNDLTALSKGYVTVTPLDYDLTKHAEMLSMRAWSFRFDV